VSISREQSFVHDRRITVMLNQQNMHTPKTKTKYPQQAAD
jgi:hypothetical protein